MLTMHWLLGTMLATAFADVVSKGCRAPVLGR